MPKRNPIRGVSKNGGNHIPNEIEETGLRHVIRSGFLYELLKYVTSKFSSIDERVKLYKFVSYIDMDFYEKSHYESFIPLKILQLYLQCVCEHRMESSELIKQAMLEEGHAHHELINGLEFEHDNVSHEECVWYREYIADRISQVELLLRKDKIVGLFSELDDMRDTHTSYFEMGQKIKEGCTDLLLALEASKEDDHLVRDFSFTDKNSSDMLNKLINGSKSAKSMLQSGIRQFNHWLSPAFAPGGLYIVIGASGKFKSGTLLNLADQIRYCNPQLRSIRDESGMIPTILFVTVENSINQSIARLYSMYAPPGSHYRTDPEEKILAVLSSITHKDENGDPISDIKFVYGRSMQYSAADIQTDYYKMKSNGMLPIAIVVDYIKPMKSLHQHNGDEKQRLNNITQELKDTAVHFDIPVITAAQVNRTGAANMKEAEIANMSNLKNAMSAINTGGSWGVNENVDLMFAVYLTQDPITSANVLSFKLEKCRDNHIPEEDRYFIHPFTSPHGMRLVPDVLEEKSASMLVLGSDLTGPNESIHSYNARQESLMSKNGLLIPKPEEVGENADTRDSVKYLASISSSDISKLRTPSEEEIEEEEEEIPIQLEYTPNVNKYLNMKNKSQEEIQTTDDGIVQKSVEAIA